MNKNTKTVKVKDMKTGLSTLWIFVMFNMAFADIVGFINPGALEEIMAGTGVTQGFLLIAAILLEIPIAMIVLSRVLKYGANRWANIIAGAITILFVVGLGNASLSYIFFASIEVAAMLLIIWFAWKWPNPEG